VTKVLKVKISYALSAFSKNKVSRGQGFKGSGFKSFCCSHVSTLFPVPEPVKHLSF
jgi:hypothetical protein